ncbi:hypothetical protein GGR57DRAFT_481772 [Xylariaceae sp. FL1272]|nr:hypothetical protein GGR57DRAFT_481772 [Xylariaceae sp. FL1272]
MKGELSDQLSILYLHLASLGGGNMLRRPPKPFYLGSSALIALFLVYHWIYPQFWLPAGARVSVGSDLVTQRSIQDIRNATLGFEKIFVINMPSRADRRDSTILAAALSDMDIEFVDGVNGGTIPDKALAKTFDYQRLDDPTLGAWRGHINAIQEVVRRNLSSALIMEDDGDWDVRIRDQLQNFALASYALTQPLVNPDEDKYADITYPTSSNDTIMSVPDLDFRNLPTTVAPINSPYGDEWDVLWLGHCGMRFPFADKHVIPKGRVAHFDETVPERRYLWTITNPNDLKDQYLDHVRVTHHVQEGRCSLAYAITQKSARKLLYEVGMKDSTDPFDIMLSWFCEGTGRPNRGYHNCLTATPSPFQIHLTAGPKSYASDIADHGEGNQGDGTTMVRTSVKMNAAALMDGRTDLPDAYPDSS